jgi:hypothetical protein
MFLLFGGFVKEMSSNIFHSVINLGSLIPTFQGLGCFIASFWSLLRVLEVQGGQFDGCQLYQIAKSSKTDKWTPGAYA